MTSTAQLIAVVALVLVPLYQIRLKDDCYSDGGVAQMVFDYEEGDVFSCMADIGWITGHSYAVYGPLSNGATTVLFESTPTYPNPGKHILAHFANK